MNEVLKYDKTQLREHIMALINALDLPVEGKTLFMYQMFKIFKEVSPEIYIPFFPYQLGPYSNAVSHEFNWLVENGYIEVSKKGNTFRFTYSKKGNSLCQLSKTKLAQITRIKINAHNLGLKSMRASFRINYPEYMVYSRV